MGGVVKLVTLLLRIIMMTIMLVTPSLGMDDPSSNLGMDPCAQNHVSPNMKVVCAVVEWFINLCPEEQCGAVQKVYAVHNLGSTGDFEKQYANMEPGEQHDRSEYTRCSDVHTRCHLTAILMEDVLVDRSYTAEPVYVSQRGIEITQSGKSGDGPLETSKIMELLKSNEDDLIQAANDPDSSAETPEEHVFVHRFYISRSDGGSCHHFVLVGPGTEYVRPIPIHYLPTTPRFLRTYLDLIIHFALHTNRLCINRTSASLR